MPTSSILANLYNSQDLNDCIRKMVRPDHRDDFKQELFLILHEKPKQTIISLNESGDLRYYVVRIILNLVNQKRNVYHKKYNDHTIKYDTTVFDKHIYIDEIEDVNKKLIFSSISNAGIDHDSNFEDRLIKEETERRLVDAFNNLDDKFNTFYHRTLINLIKEHGSQRKVSRLTGIPLASISEAVKKVRNHLISII